MAAAPAGVALSKGIQKAWLNKQLALHGRVIEQHLSQQRFCRFTLQHCRCADEFSAAGIADARRAGEMPATARWLEMQQRAAWQRALEQGGPIQFNNG